MEKKELIFLNKPQSTPNLSAKTHQWDSRRWKLTNQHKSMQDSIWTNKLWPLWRLLCKNNNNSVKTLIFIKSILSMHRSYYTINQMLTLTRHQHKSSFHGDRNQQQQLCKHMTDTVKRDTSSHCEWKKLNWPLQLTSTGGINLLAHWGP